MDIESLTNSLCQYKQQLLQVDEALKSTAADQHEALKSLKTDLEELINLTSENIEKLNIKKHTSEKGVPPTNLQHNSDDPFDKEYALFMEEVAKTEPANDSTSDIDQSAENDLDDNNIEDQLKSLEGKKCGVLFSNDAGDKPSFYNAMVCSILSDSKNFDDIQVRVLFTNPTQIDMIPCPFYLEGGCKFDDDVCKYSHGEVVSLSSLQTATEPDFTSLKIGGKILAKIKYAEKCSTKVLEKYLLWHRAIVKSIDFENHSCRVKLENDTLFVSGGTNDYEAQFADIFPLVDDCYDSESDISILDNIDDFLDKPNGNESLPNIELWNISTEKMGEWEKYTKGIGSKLMIKMGYIIGTGLGPQNDGRTQPVPAQVLPAGRSLDHCMELKEKFADKDLFKAEKRLLRLQKKTERQEKLAFERAKNKEKHDVFNFLNTTLLNNSKKESNKKSDLNNTNLKTASCKNLNIERFKLDENMRKLEKDIVKLKHSIARNSHDSLLHKDLSSKLNSKVNDLRELKSKESKITNEQNIRKDKKKMSIF